MRLPLTLKGSMVVNSSVFLHIPHIIQVFFLHKIRYILTPHLTPHLVFFALFYLKLP